LGFPLQSLSDFFFSLMDPYLSLCVWPPHCPFSFRDRTRLFDRAVPTVYLGPLSSFPLFQFFVLRSLPEIFFCVVNCVSIPSTGPGFPPTLYWPSRRAPPPATALSVESSRPPPPLPVFQEFFFCPVVFPSGGDCKIRSLVGMRGHLAVCPPEFALAADWRPGLLGFPSPPTTPPLIASLPK